MSFGEAVRVCLAKYVDFSGRARRSEYWWFWLFNLIASGVAAGLDGVLESSVVGIVVGLGLLLPGFSVTARRLHDIDRSGYWMLLPMAAVIPGAIVAFTDAGPAALGVMVLGALAGTLALVVLLVRAGSEGENRFGPAPA